MEDNGYLLARLEALETRQSDMCKFMEQQNAEISKLRSDLFEFNAGFRAVKWVGLLLLGIVALARGDTSIIAKVFGG